MNFRLKKIENGISKEIINNNYSLDKEGISNWLIGKNMMAKNEVLKDFTEVNPWTRTGGETYSTIFEFTTSKQYKKIFVKAIVTTHPEKSLTDWSIRRNILNKNRIPVSNWIWTGEATIYEPFYPKTVLEINEITNLFKIAFKLDRLGFASLKYLDDIRCDENGNPYFVDFGFDLGEPSVTTKTLAKEYFIKKYPNLKTNINEFYDTNSL